jgi:hypothetical protein
VVMTDAEKNPLSKPVFAKPAHDQAVLHPPPTTTTAIMLAPFATQTTHCICKQRHGP